MVSSSLGFVGQVSAALRLLVSLVIVRWRQDAELVPPPPTPHTPLTPPTHTGCRQVLEFETGSQLWPDCLLFSTPAPPPPTRCSDE